MKFVAGAILMILLGYGIAIFLPPTSFEFLSDAKQQIEESLDLASTEEALIPGADVDEPASLPDPIDGRYLQEVDLVQVPGLGGLLTLRVGSPTSRSNADQLIAALPADLNPVMVRFVTATGARRVQVLAGQFDDPDAADLRRRALQPRFNERLEVSYLPACARDGMPDDEGYGCGDKPSDPSE